MADALHGQAVDTIRTIFDEVLTSDNVIGKSASLGTILSKLTKDYHRIAGSFVDVWAAEHLEAIASDTMNRFGLTRVKRGQRLSKEDLEVYFSWLEGQPEQPVLVNFKATSLEIETSGKNPNLVSYGKIRYAFTLNPRLIYMLVSFKHRRHELGIEISSVDLVELKDLHEGDIVYNRRLNQLQLRDIRQIRVQPRTVDEFIRIIDEKFIRSRGKGEWQREIDRFRTGSQAR